MTRVVRVTLSRSTLFFPVFSWIIQLVLFRRYSHTSIHFIDPYTGQWMASETSHGEAHEMTIDKWRNQNKIVAQWQMIVTDDQFREFKIISNGFQQIKYTPFFGLIGILIYIVTNGKIKWFEDGTRSLFCSESDAYKLSALGVHFLKDRNFITPKDIEKKMLFLEKVDERVTRMV